MKIIINGTVRDLPEGLTLEGCLAELTLDPRTTVVERNREVVPRENYPTLLLQDGDVLELVRFVGGG